jgi:hypothetical protein
MAKMLLKCPFKDCKKHDEGCIDKVGLMMHLTHNHKKLPLESKRDMVEKALETAIPTPEKETVKKQLMQCKHCNHKPLKHKGAYAHFRKHGVSKAVEGTDFEYVEGEVKRAYKKSGEFKRKPLVLTPSSTFISIPVILRVPITIGTAVLAGMESDVPVRRYKKRKT